MNSPIRKLQKSLPMSCHQCAWWRGRCICPQAVSRNGSKCDHFQAGMYQVYAGYGARFTGGRHSRPWLFHQSVDVWV